MFTDADVPGMIDGLKLASYIRNRWPPIKIIVASGKEIIAESRLPAGSIFFSKPYHDPQIAEALVAMLRT